MEPATSTMIDLAEATYAALGESQKLIGYRLGLSSGRVSTLLRDAMRKLGASTLLELVAMIGHLDEDE